MTEHRNNQRKLLDFQFKRHRLYNLPEQRLELIEAVVHEQARKLLKEKFYKPSDTMKTGNWVKK